MCRNMIMEQFVNYSGSVLCTHSSPNDGKMTRTTTNVQAQHCFGDTEREEGDFAGGLQKLCKRLREDRKIRALLLSRHWDRQKEGATNSSEHRVFQ